MAAVVKTVTLLERYRASVVLHAVGDCMGYRNDKWEFLKVGRIIHDQLKKLGGVDALVLEPKEWIVSDDTIFHLANMECLIENKGHELGKDVYNNLIKHYQNAMKDMDYRAPGLTCIDSVNQLKLDKDHGYQIPFNPRGGGCGSSMRSSCIGLRYAREDQLNDLIEFSIESGRMTHHHPMGYLGGLAAALFTAYAIRDIPIKTWGYKCLKDLDKAKDYVKNSNHFVSDNLKEWSSFTEPWERYLRERGIENGENEPVFPEKYDVDDRDQFYKKIANISWPGAVGVDSVLIAYDGLLGCQGDWRELCLRAMLHGGDNDSTGCLAGSWYGAIYGFTGVNENNYKKLEYLERLEGCAKELHDIEWNNTSS